MKRSFVFSAVFVVALGVAGCDKPGEPEAASRVERPATAAPGSGSEVVVLPSVQPVDPESAVVTVNGTTITEGQVDEQMGKRLAVQRQRMPAGMEIPEEQKQLLRSKVVDLMVEMALVSEKLAEKKLTVTDAQVSEAVEKIAGEQNQTVAELGEEIVRQGMTMEDLREQIGMRLSIETLMDAERHDVSVTGAEAKSFYDQNPQHFQQPEQVQASHILCGKRGITEEEYPAELEKIKAAQARLNAGEAFADVAKETSACPSSAQGGDLGFFGRGQMDPAFEKAAFETEVGQTTGVIKTSFGYHLIKVTDKKPATQVPFEEVEDDISQYLTRLKKQEFWIEYNQTLKEGATIAFSPSEQRARAAAERQQSLQQQMLERQMVQ